MRQAAELASGSRTDGRPTVQDSRWRVAFGCLAWACIHSALAAQPTKVLASHLAGLRARNGCYRCGYTVLATVLGLGFARWFRRLPDRTLYRVPPPWSWLLHGAQLLSLGWLFAGVAAVGLGRSTGVSQLLALLRGRWPPPEPEDQGPAFVAGQAVPRGPFRLSRHPNNLVGVVFFWLMPHMTVNRATLAAAATVYAVLGSLHEEARLLRVYDIGYRRYQRQVPFLVPRLQLRSRRRDSGSCASTVSVVLRAWHAAC